LCKLLFVSVKFIRWFLKGDKLDEFSAAIRVHKGVQFRNGLDFTFANLVVQGGIFKRIRPKHEHLPFGVDVKDKPVNVFVGCEFDHRITLAGFKIEIGSIQPYIRFKRALFLR